MYLNFTEVIACSVFLAVSVAGRTKCLPIRKTRQDYSGYGPGSYRKPCLGTGPNCAVTVFNYLGVNSVVPLYTAMFNEMNNFDRLGGQGGIGMGQGLLQNDGSVVTPTTPAPTPMDSYNDYGSYYPSYDSKSSNSNGYGGYNARKPCLGTGPNCAVTVSDYLGVNSVVPLYTAMFKEMNNFDRQGGMGGIGMGDGLLQFDGTVSREAPSGGSGNGYYSGRNQLSYGSRSRSDIRPMKQSHGWKTRI